MSILNWKTMSNDEKSNQLHKIAELKGIGFSWDEIGDFYSVKASTIRDYYDNHKIRKSEEIAESIITGTTKMEISQELLFSLLEKIESLELEVANIKKLQVETASIEKLEQSEYKYFVKDRNTGEEYKYREIQELCDFLNNSLCLAVVDSGYVTRQIQVNNGSFTFKNYIISASLKTDIDNTNSKLNSAVDDIADIFNNIAAINEQL